MNRTYLGVDMADNTLYYGDNLEILRRYITDESVDLVYLDPPFNSNAKYNVLFAEKDGADSASQIQAFDDTWHWDEAAALAYDDVMQQGEKVADAMQAFRNLLGENDMLAYLAMMAPRLVELNRVLKPTGSIYLHCDPTASHYLKVLMDAVFGTRMFVNEIVWKRSDAHSDAKQGARHYGRVHDTLLFYSKTDTQKFTQLYSPLPESTVEKWYRNVEEGTGRRYNKGDMTGPGGAAKGNPFYEWNGVSKYWRYSKESMEKLEAEGRIVYSKTGMSYQKRYLDESRGVPVQDWWDDISMLRGIHSGGERLGYPTQKPEALLERVLNTSSNEGDVVLDPFCGCGTAIIAAQKLNRKWIGIDITPLATNLIKFRLKDTFGDVPYEVVGEPVSVPDAQKLAAEDPYHFQYWALGLVGARPVAEKKGADKGIDGRRRFYDPNAKGNYAQIILSVKAGKTQVPHVRDLRGVIEREEAAIGVLISMQEPTKPMRTEAASAGFYESPWGKHPRIQLLTIEELLNGARIDCPQTEGVDATFRKAKRQKAKQSDNQTTLLDSD